MINEQLKHDVKIGLTFGLLCFEIPSRNNLIILVSRHTSTYPSNWKYPNWFERRSREYFSFTHPSFLCALLLTGWVVFQVRIFSQLTRRSSSGELAEFKQAVKHRTVLSDVDCKMILTVSYTRALTTKEAAIHATAVMVWNTNTAKGNDWPLTSDRFLFEQGWF